MTVSIHSDTKALAEQYDSISESQFDDGCVLLEKLSVKPGHSVLDIGCGTGILARKIVAIIGNSGKYFGVEPSQERLNIAVGKNWGANAIFNVGAAEGLAFIADHSMDESIAELGFSLDC